MTKTEKKWKLLPEKSGQDCGIPDWLFGILASRGVETKEEIEAYLNPKYEHLRNPNDFSNMKEAVERISLAKEKNEKVVIYGDYDVDGICATAIVFEALNKIGVQNVETYIPHREEEGYGLNEKALAEIKEKGASLVVSVDCGITSRELIDASELDFIVCDHHEISEEKLPQKAIILHPQMVEGEKENLCGAGMAFFFVLALQKAFSKEFVEGQEKWFLDLAALATICDVVPLFGQNRILAKWGILVLSKTKRVGLRALLKAASVEPEDVSAYVVGFVIGPRLNAAGRLEHAQRALELVLTNDEKRARQIARELNSLNIERQKMCSQILEEAKAEIEKSSKEKEIFLLSNKNWPRGVVGIIASRLSDAYGRPVIVFEDDGEHCHGSARSVEGFDITEALAETSEYLVKFGGHAKAAGLTVKTEHFVAFGEKLLEVARGKLTEIDLAPEIQIDAEISPEEITDETMELLAKMEPFGYGNKTPVFLMQGAEIENVKKVGGNGEHLKFEIKRPADGNQGAGLGGIWFSYPQEFNSFFNVQNSKFLFDIVFTLKYNIWNNRKSIEVRVIDAKEPNAQKERRPAEKELSQRV